MSQIHPRILTRTRATQILSQFPAKRVLVAGDLMLDEFLWGKVSRISPEAPVPVVEVVRESAYPGGAANVARNLREFTGHVSVLGVIGDDANGEKLLGLLAERQIAASGIGRVSGTHTIVKTRVIARQQQVVRVDRDRRTAVTPDLLEGVRRHLAACMGEVDAVICAD